MTGTETVPPAEAEEPQPSPETPTAAVLPPDAPQRRRRTALRTHPVRTGVVAVLVVAVVVAVPVLVLKASHTIANSKAGRTITALNVVTSRLPDTPVALLVVKGADGAVAGLTLLARDGSGSGGAAVILPAGTEIPGLDGQPGTRLAGAYDRGGLAAEREAVEGLLGITTSGAEEVDENGLAQLFQPYAPIHIALETRALDTGSNGEQTVLFPAGEVDLDAAQAARLLIARGPSESEAARLARTTAIWAAVLAAGAGKEAPEPDPSAPTVAGQLAAVAGGRSAARAIPVRPILDAVANPSGLDLLQPDAAATKLVLAQVMPGAISPASDNIRLQVVNATGDPALLADAVTRLVGVGANVVIVSDAASPSPSTVIEYQDPRNQAEAETYRPVVGPATVRQGDERIDGLDATIILGQDFATFAEQQAASSTTSTPSPSSTGP